MVPVYVLVHPRPGTPLAGDALMVKNYYEFRDESMIASLPFGCCSPPFTSPPRSGLSISH